MKLEGLEGFKSKASCSRCGVDLGPWEDGPGILAVPQQ